ncbi:phosphatase PAP2 family protein, partial [Nocardia farcinica]|uniref:phosphatase PAP2 family protein n=1 Tax=Nocardia farcinica TaxID=37329 RepID=UPI002454351A
PPPHSRRASGAPPPLRGGPPAATLLLYRAGDRAHAALVAVAGLGAALIVFGGKRIIGRERPPVVDRLAVENSLAYPSGHSVGTFVVIGIVAVVLIPKLTGTLARIATGTAAALFVVAVGCSRVYLGVHWPTDVLGAWCVSAAWILFCLTVFHYRREVPDEPVPDAESPTRTDPRTVPDDDL